MHSTETENRWEYFVKYLPILPILISIISAIKIKLFYSIYNIEVTGYFEPSEILLSFLDDLPFLLVIILFFVTILQRIVTKKISNSIFNYIFRNKALWLVVGYYSLYLLAILGAIIPLFLFIDSIEANKTIQLPILMVFILIIIASTTPLFSYLFQLQEIFPKNLSITIYAYSNILSILIFYLILELLIKYNLTEGNYRKGSTIITNSTIYKIDSLNLYLGSSINYHFLYNKKSKTSIIIPSSDIKELKLTSNKIEIKKLQWFH
ncbi:hypothetical protein EXU85_16215 [Spirosoma sp. KCTC 42546]|uniref:hypothetical protein n=1 Tax=Spirosoma sp. KCTC 42546 TaxID=2520506 RepID=UPI001159E59D|nr:hypothetical protein [Spirosoma sp. KCTC 42546]QDK80069.1 hypothetical protein EXU85_16215 [Spirosoma sp. KCTC 42546]